MTTYQSKDFKNMMFPVFDIPPKADLFLEFPVLSEVHAFSNTSHELDHYLVIRYVLFCYDRNSKLMEISDLPKRKEVAVGLAGFKKITGEVELMTANKLPQVNDMIVAFCRIQNNRLFQMKLSALEAFKLHIIRIKITMIQLLIQLLNQILLK